MDAVTPKDATQHATTHATPCALPIWNGRRRAFRAARSRPCCSTPQSGLVTVLTRFAPGAVLPDHEHVKIEQTYVLEGRLVDQEGPDAGLSVGPGEFVWRPAGSRHSACAPEGGVMLAMFQLPNKFFERDGRVTDANGEDWERVWGGCSRNNECRMTRCAEITLSVPVVYAPSLFADVAKR